MKEAGLSITPRNISNHVNCMSSFAGSLSITDDKLLKPACK
jgi:hypothetical protein